MQDEGVVFEQKKNSIVNEGDKNCFDSLLSTCINKLGLPKKSMKQHVQQNTAKYTRYRTVA